MEVLITMPKYMTAVSDADAATGGVALAEPAPRPDHPRALGPLVAPLAAMVRDIDRVIQRHAPHPGAGQQIATVSPAVSHSVVDRNLVGDGPIGGLAVSPDGRRLFVTNSADSSVSVIDAESFLLLDIIAGTPEPFAIAAGGNDRVYVGTGSTTEDAILVIDHAVGTVTGNYSSAAGVNALVVDPTGRRVYASRTGASGANVAVLDVATGRIDSIDLAVEPGVTATSLTISPDGRRLYVAIQWPAGSQIAVIDTRSRRMVDSIEAAGPIRDFAVSPNGDTVYLAVEEPELGGVVEVVEMGTKTVSGRVQVGGLLTQLVLSRDGGRVFLVNGDVVTVVCTRSLQVIDTIAVEAQPSCVVESPTGRRLYVADYAGVLTAVAITAVAADRSRVGAQRQLKPAV